jgi:hypothetical protein
MSSLDLEYEPYGFAHECELSPLDTVAMTEEVFNSLDDILLEVYDHSEQVF